MEPRQPHEGHRKRIKERYLEKGLPALDDKDILELILTYSIPRKDVYELSRSLVHEFGSVEKVLSASPDELRERAGLTDHTLVLLKLINDLRTTPGCFIEYRHEKLGSVKAAVEYCHRVLAGFSEETIVELFLDGESCVTELTKMSRGNSEAAVLPIDRIVESAIRHRVKRLMIAHNHPSGSSAPSSADILATDMLKNALYGHGIELVEHIIVAKNECTALMHHQTIEIKEGESFAPWKIGE